MRDTILNLRGEFVVGKNIKGIRPDHIAPGAEIDTLAIDGTNDNVLDRVLIAPLDANKIDQPDHLIKKGVLVVQKDGLRVIAIPGKNVGQKGYIFLPVEEKVDDKVQLLPPNLWATVFIHNLGSLNLCEGQQKVGKFLEDLTNQTAKRRDVGDGPAKIAPKELVAQQVKVYNRPDNGPFIPSRAHTEPQAQKAAAEQPGKVVAAPAITAENATGTWPAIDIDSLPPAKLDIASFAREGGKTLASGPDGRPTVEGNLNAKYVLQTPTGQFTIGPENSGSDIAIKLKGLGETIKIGVAVDQEAIPHCVVNNLGNGVVQRLNFLAPGQQVNLPKGGEDHIGIVFQPTSYRLPNGNIISIRQILGGDMKPQIIVEVYEETKRR